MGLMCFDIYENPYPAEGVIFGVQDSASNARSNSIVAEFQHLTNIGAAADDPFDFQVFKNNIPVKNIDKDDKKLAVIPITRSQEHAQINVLPTKQFMSESHFFDSVSTSKRLIITATQNTEIDFEKYQLYWDLGEGGDFSLLQENYGADNNIFVTDELEAGVYQFKYRTVDVTGNEQAFSPILTVTHLPADIPLDSTISFSYSSTNRNLTITMQKPTGQTSQWCGYRIYSNQLPGYGLLGAIWNDFNQPYKVINSTVDVQYYTTPELYAGTWIFGVTPITEYGVERPLELYAFNLAWVDDVLTATVSAIPQEVTSFSVTALPNAQIQVDATFTYVSGDTVKLYEDGVLIDTYNQTSSGTYQITLDRVDGTEYYYEISTANPYLESAKSIKVYATADGTPPAVGTLAAEVLN